LTERLTLLDGRVEVVDRVGGGDGFAAGFIYGLLSGETPEEALKLDGAWSAVDHLPGDTTMATVDQVRSFAKADRRAFSGSNNFTKSLEIVCRKHHVYRPHRPCVMGQNLVLNMNDHGFKLPFSTAPFPRWTSFLLTKRRAHKLLERTPSRS